MAGISVTVKGGWEERTEGSGEGVLKRETIDLDGTSQSLRSPVISGLDEIQ